PARARTAGAIEAPPVVPVRARGARRRRGAAGATVGGAPPPPAPRPLRRRRRRPLAGDQRVPARPHRVAVPGDRGPPRLPDGAGLREVPRVGLARSLLEAADGAGCDRVLPDRRGGRGGVRGLPWEAGGGAGDVVGVVVR